MIAQALKKGCVPQGNYIYVVIFIKKTDNLWKQENKIIRNKKSCTMPVSADKTRWFFSLYLNGLKQAFLLSGNHDWIFATCNFYISCHEHREHAWIKFNNQVGHWDCYLFFKAWMVRGNTSKLFRTLIVWRSIKPFERRLFLLSIEGKERRSMTSGYHGSNILSFQRPFRTEPAICIVKG